MEAQFFCRACRSLHVDPSDARLGHQILCAACAFTLEIEETLALPLIPAANALAA